MRRAPNSSAPAATVGGAGNAGSNNNESHTNNRPPVAPPSSSVLYTLLQDLGLTATAQALCEELQRQQTSPTGTSNPADATGAQATAGAVVIDPIPDVPFPPVDIAAPPPASANSAPPAATAAAAAAASSPLSPPTVLADAAMVVPPSTLKESVTSLNRSAAYADFLHDDGGCMAAVAVLAAFALEPLQGGLGRTAAHNLTTIPTALNVSLTGGSMAAVEAALRTLWQREAHVLSPSRAAVHGAQEFRVMSLLARAACCEVRMAEGIFTQEYTLAHANTASAASTTSAVLHRAQTELVDHAAQLVAALQELRARTSLSASAPVTTPCAPLSALIVSRLHAKSHEWLRGAECGMTWVLRRQANFEAPPPPPTPQQQQQQPQHKRRCLEQQQQTGGGPADTCSDATVSIPTHLQPLQSAIMGFPALSTTPPAATAASGEGSHVSSHRSASRRTEAVLTFPSTVRLATVVQRVKLVTALTTGLAYNGENSIVLRVIEASTSTGTHPAATGEVHGATETQTAEEVLRRWWTWRCFVQAQLLRETSLRLRQLLPPDVTRATDTATTTTTEVADACAFVSLLEIHARQLLLSQTTADNMVVLLAAVDNLPHHNPLLLAAAVLRALESEHIERSGWLDRFLLERSSTSSLAHRPKALAAAAATAHSSGDSVRSPNISVSSPGVMSESSSVNSPVWTLPLSSLPSDTPANAGVSSSRAAAEGGAAAVDFNTVEKAHVAFDGAAATAAAARVLRWQPHFVQLLTTLATGRWIAPTSILPEVHPCSRYHRTRLSLMRAVRNAQELLRMQPRRDSTANVRDYVPRSGSHRSTDSGVVRPLVETLPRVVQLATLQDMEVLLRAQRRLAAHGSRPRVESPASSRAQQKQQRQRRRSSVSPATAAPPPTSSSTTSSTASPLRGAVRALFTGTAGSAFLTATINDSVVGVAAGSSGGDVSAERAATSRQDSPAVLNRSSAASSPDSAQAETVESLAPPSSPPSSSTSSQSVPSLAEEEEEEHSTAADATANNNSGSEEDASAQQQQPATEEGEGEEEEEEDEATDPSESDGDASAYEFEEEVHAHASEGGEDTAEEWSQSAVDVGEEDEDEEIEEEEEDEDAGEGSEASSADLDYERPEDAMKEEVECVEVTEDGRLMALLTARGRLTVLRLLASDSADHYEEEVLIDAMLPHVPGKRLQWFESLSSFVHFSPCRRFVLASVQFLAIQEKQSTRCALARSPQSNTGEVCIFSLHRSGSEDMDAEGGDDDYDGADATDIHYGERARSRFVGGSTPSTFADRLDRLVQPLPERLFECFKLHTSSCLSARWLDPRWWGGGRRSGWANAAAEPLNTTTAAAAVVVRGVEGVDTPPRAPPLRALQQQQQLPLPPSWRVAAAVLLSEYHCLSIGLDDRLVRWMPSSGVVLQCILTEPLQDLVVSPLMAAFYVVTDAGDLCMYDAWDERDIGDEGSTSIWANPRDVCEYDAHPLMLAVTEDGHPCCYRTGASTLPYARSAESAAQMHDSSASLQQQQQSARRRTLTREEGRRGGFDDEVHVTRHAVHYTGPVTPVFQRMMDPVEKQRRRMPLLHESTSCAQRRAAMHNSRSSRHGGLQGDGEDEAIAGKGMEGDDSGPERGGGGSGGSAGVSYLPRGLRWLLPRRWTAHTPWDAQLGRRLIRHLLRRSTTPSYADEGQLHYACDDDVDSGDALADVMRRAGGVASRRQSQVEHGDEEAEEEGASQRPRDFADREEEAKTSFEEGSDETEGWEYDYTCSAHREDDGVRPPRIAHQAAAASHGAASASAMAAARDVPVAVSECPTHPTPARGTLRRAYYPSGACLIYKNVARALCAANDLADRQRNEDMGPGGQTHHILSCALSGAPQWTAERRLRGRGQEDEEEQEDRRCGGTVEDDVPQQPAPSLHWPTAALARLVLWRGCLASLRHFNRVPSQTRALWESRVLATTYHADVVPAAVTTDRSNNSSGSSHVRFSATQLLASRGYQRPRDVWRRGAPTTQRGLAATARNGRLMCIMASVGPYRKLVKASEPLRDVKGFYACVVFDLYAGAVLRVMPVCPVDPTGLRGVSMFTSQQHGSGTKMPIYRLQCAVTIVPVVAAPAAGDADGKQGDNGNVCEDREDEAAEPTEIVAVTIGGLANTVYVYDAMTGRRIACTREVEHRSGLSAAAAYAAYHAADAHSEVRVEPSPLEAAVHDTASETAPNATPTSAAVLTPSLGTSSMLPSSIRKPSDVLASVATWSRGTGFDGITDHSTSTSSSAEELVTRRGGRGVPAETHARAVVVGARHQKLQNEDVNVSAGRSSHNTAQLEAAQRALHDALHNDGRPLPSLLQYASSSSSAVGVAWGLREILAEHHRRHGPSRLSASAAAATMGGERSSSSSSSTSGSGSSGKEEDSECEEGRTIREAVSNRHTPPPLRQQQQQNRGNGKCNGQAADMGRSAPAAASSPTSALSSFYYSLLGGPTARTATTGSNGAEQHHVEVSARRAAWRHQRQRLLERVLRHYPVDLLWQAYVALFAASTTALNADAPLSAVAGLVQWAHQTVKATTNAVKGAAPPAVLAAAPSPSWVWCGPRRRCGCFPLLRTASAATAADKTREREAAQCTKAEKDATASSGGGDDDDGSSSSGVYRRVPFADVLRQREEFMGALQELESALARPTGSRTCAGSDVAAEQPPPPSSLPHASLLSKMRAKAMLDGSLPPGARLLRTQQRAAGSRSRLKFPPAHHQNQLRLDVVNTVATWLDANGGFYVCFGSEDGRLYLLGGNVDT